MTDTHRATRVMSVFTALSRVSGFVRIVVFVNIFGASYLANTYHSANTVPNILFELLAAGALQAVLVPTMVRLGASGAATSPDDAAVAVAAGAGVAAQRGQRGSVEAEDGAGAVLGALLVIMTIVGAVAAVCAPWLMEAMVGSVRSARIRAQEVRLGTVLLWIFLPQLLFYGANIVATAVLNARHHFAVPAIAPLANNVVVIASYFLFAAVHTGRMSLTLTPLEVAILGGGTTLAVLAFCSLPVIALVRSGFRLRPRFQLRNPLLRSLAVEGSWAALFLAATQVVQFVVLRQSNRVAGGTNVYQFAFILFTLPYSLFAVPVMTTRFPQMSGAALHRRWDEFAEITRGAVRSILFTGFLAGAVTAAVALPVARMLTVSTDATMAARIGEATVAFAPAVVGYGLVLFFTRAFYAVGDPRTPALINVVLAGLAAVLMGFGASQLSDRNLVTGLAAAFAVTYVIGSIVMAWLLAQRLNGEGVTGLRTLRGPVLRGLVAATLAGAAGWGVVRLIGFDSRVEAAVSVAAGGVVVLALFLATQAGTGGPGVRLAVRTLGAGEPASRENRVSR